MPLDGRRCGPMVCTSHSVRMIQRDLKTHSRRICKRTKAFLGVCGSCWFSSEPRGAEHLTEVDGSASLTGSIFGTVPHLRVPRCTHIDASGIGPGVVRSPYGTRGDRLWVRESCRQYGDGSYLYRADVPDDEAKMWGPWGNVRFVPKESARIWLEVIDVRVERLRDMTVDDAVAEGVVLEAEDPLAAFAKAWDTINGKRDGGNHAWAANPWVWRLLFRRVES